MTMILKSTLIYQIAQKIEVPSEELKTLTYFSDFV